MYSIVDVVPWNRPSPWEQPAALVTSLIIWFGVVYFSFRQRNKIKWSGFGAISLANAMLPVVAGLVIYFSYF